MKTKAIGILISMLFLIMLSHPVKAAPVATVFPIQQAISFQDEGTLTYDDTTALSSIDSDYGPTTTGTVSRTYYATCTSGSFFDAVTIKFNLDLTGISVSKTIPAVLNMHIQIGEYAGYPGYVSPYPGVSVTGSEGLWHHYAIQSGYMNPEYEDCDPAWVPPYLPPTARPFPYTTEWQWVMIDMDLAQIDSDGWVTIRLWNVRVDYVELQVFSEGWTVNWIIETPTKSNEIQIPEYGSCGIRWVLDNSFYIEDNDARDGLAIIHIPYTAAGYHFEMYALGKPGRSGTFAYSYPYNQPLHRERGKPFDWYTEIGVTGEFPGWGGGTWPFTNDGLHNVKVVVSPL